ncbi:aldehyde dehydrogenase [Gloeocapsa sp. PCC 73106]|uniref:aldehyde dehydrogenase family protein n=1 Tax=Gloeocapsa sp. PCC 73106 TaxID=102232 RepID=UPI0002AC4D36|nr:aldehyde dehydrogenase family protein [Gloeocapsa sp. PCC 73106]ELR96616.1 NAD-dependent aldehyde dehydrogenase [Gloeocapsa sp. PCC 73106]
MVNFPQEILNWIDGQQLSAQAGGWFPKLNPNDGQILCQVARSQAEDVAMAVKIARNKQSVWSEVPPVKRGEILHDLVLNLKRRQTEMARVVASETGKSYREALGETAGAIALGLFYASEGQRLYGRTTTSAVAHKHALTVRQPLGVAGLIIAANTPIANVAWKVFPALICGNTAILKAAEDTPATAWLFGEIAQEAGLPPGVLNIIQGYGEEAGAPLVEHPEVDVISFTGSTEVGRKIQAIAGPSLKRISLELGGKNPLVVCDDADLDNAVKWILLSAFSNAGQRCAAASRIIIFDAIYEQLRELLITKTKQLKVGTSDEDDFGPVINLGQLEQMLAAINQARQGGARILVGGDRLRDPQHCNGYYLAPTLLENIPPDANISQTELFGPIAILYRVANFAEALTLANDSPYGLTAAIHTRNLHRAVRFCEQVQAGVAVVNAGTYGSEPHMPFGGFKQSGNGTREPGTEALDVYSQLKDIYINIDPNQL